MADASEKLSRMVAADSEPTLTSGDLATLLEMFAKADKNGVAPSEPEWIPSYNLRAAAAEGWRWKAAKAAELISSDLDGDRMSSNQLFEHCQRMIRTYAGSASVQVATPNTGKYPSIADEFFD